MKKDNQNMDRAIPVSIQRKRKMMKAVKYIAIAAVVLTVVYVLGTAIYRYRRAQHQQHYTRYRKR